MLCEWLLRVYPKQTDVNVSSTYRYTSQRFAKESFQVISGRALSHTTISFDRKNPPDGHRDVGDHSIDGKPWSRWMSEIWWSIRHQVLMRRQFLGVWWLGEWEVMRCEDLVMLPEWKVWTGETWWGYLSSVVPPFLRANLFVLGLDLRQIWGKGQGAECVIVDPQFHFQ